MAAPGLVEVVEGATKLLVPERHTTKGPAARAGAQGTFYNAAMAAGRDVSVLYMRARHGDADVRALDVLAGTGARGVRWVVEARLKRVRLNDRSEAACDLIRRNLALNGAEAEVVQREAHDVLADGGFQHLELDPYGTPAPFLDAAFRGLGRRGGVSFTATDAAVLCGAQKRVCARRYGARPTRTPDLTHEAALRILLGAAAREAAKNDQGLAPALANAREHYFRCYVETRRSAAAADAALAQVGWLVECGACLHRSLEKEALRACPACAQPARASGPLWTGPLWDRPLLAQLAKLREAMPLARPRAIERDLALWGGEAEAGGLPWDAHAVGKRERVRQPAPAELLVAILRERGFAASRTHLGGMWVRTPAPAAEVVRAVRDAGAAHGGDAGPG